MKCVVKVDYRKRRAQEYPPINDQLDAIWKAMTAMPITAEGDAMRKRIQAIKNKFPKDGQ